MGKGEVVAEIQHKQFKIMIEEMKSVYSHHYCAYVSHPDFLGKNYERENKGSCTYHEKDTIGFDSAHYYNINMTMPQKLGNVLKQAINFLDNEL